MEEKSIKADVIVLGAGLAGLAAADRLVSKGRDVALIEKEETSGGMCRSFKQQGFSFDLGGHRFLPDSQQAADYLRALFSPKSDELALRARLSQIYLRNKFLNYPPELLDLLQKLGLLVCFKGGLDSFYARLRQYLLPKKEISLKDWMINRFGPTLYDIYFGPYSLKLWGREVSRISADWAPQRISVLSIGYAIKNLFLHNSTAKTYASEFLYPKNGIGEICSRMADKITSAGARIFTNHKVEKVSILPNGFGVTARRKDGSVVSFFAHKLISTIPLNEFVFACSPQLPIEVLSAAKSLRFRSLRFLNLMLDCLPVTLNTWVYVPERNFTFFRIQELSRWHPANCPEGKTALTLEIACEKNSRLWNMPEEELTRLCLKDLAKMGIRVEDKLIKHFCTYLEEAYPVYALSYKKYLNIIYSHVKNLENITLAGRQGLFRYLNMDAVIDNGFFAAESLFNEDLRLESLNSLK